MPSIGYLGPESQTYGWHVANSLVDKIGMNVDLCPEDSQPLMLEQIMKGFSHHAACVVAYSNTLGIHSVPEVGQLIKRYTRTDTNGGQRLQPDQLLAIARTSIQQCLIGKEIIDYKSVKKIYAHPAAAQQVSSWFTKNNLNNLVELCNSNGEAINKALQNNDPKVLAVGPKFAMNQGQILLEEGIDNSEGSETSFALISNSKKPLIFPDNYIHRGKSAALVYAKVDEDLGGHIQFPGMIWANGIKLYGNRTTNSPASGKTVLGYDIEGNGGKIDECIDELLGNGSGLGIDISFKGTKHSISGLQGIAEVNFLGSTPLFQV